MRKAVIGVLGAVASLLVAPVMAQEMMETATIADIVVASATGETPEFSTLLAAVQAADPAVLEALSNPDAELTVFAPTDAAFAALAEALGEEAFNAVLADTEFLTNILLYHVVGEVLMSTDVVAALDMVAEVQEAWGLVTATASVETLLGQSIDFAYTEDGISVDGANIVLDMVDIAAANGVIHVIDAVLLPETRTLADIVVEAASAEEGAEFTTLLTAVQAADPSVLEILSDPEGAYTVFAPTDAAFAALIEALGEEAFNGVVADTEALTGILAFHVVEGAVGSTALSGLLGEDGMVDVTTLGGGTLSIMLDPENGLIINGNTKIIMVDIDASNGVIHVIDAVLLPE
jgi:transforming growth factor-beta-induced protein